MGAVDFLYHKLIYLTGAGISVTNEFLAYKGGVFQQKEFLPLINHEVRK